jgi:hypothetical protein
MDPNTKEIMKLLTAIHKELLVHRETIKELRAEIDRLKFVPQPVNPQLTQDINDLLKMLNGETKNATAVPPGPSPT